MNNNDEIILTINKLIKIAKYESNIEISEESIYRKEIVNRMFCVLNQMNQEIVMKLIFDKLSQQCESINYLE